MSEQSTKKVDNRTLMLDALRKIDSLQARLDQSEKKHSEAIAIVGMGCRFPGAEKGLDEYRQLLTQGLDAIGNIPAQRWAVEQYFHPDPDQPGKMYVKEGGFINRVDEFDAEFFDISPREAIAMDPQQRLWLEVCWEALEQGNIVPAELFASRTGVFAGASSFDFAALLAKNLPLDQIDAYLGTGASLNILAGRLSYLLGLTGPSMAVDTACSSSLVAVHNACQSLRNHECEMAIAGGVNVILAPETYVAFSRAHMLSPEARCKTFAEQADGFIRSEGCGAIVLKRLSDAQQHGDDIWAVIKGSAVNQDGASGGLTVPSGPSQQAVIQSALTAAQIKPEQVGLIEAHGTGTPLGDPIEMRSLAACYGHTQQPVFVASVKTNLGHLEAAAGIAGLIKSVFSLKYAEIYPHLHFSQPSSHIDWQSWPVTIPQQYQSWPETSNPRTAALSSFGLSGTNSHLILQQAPEPAKKQEQWLDQSVVPLLQLSAKNQAALQSMAGDYALRLKNCDLAEFDNICFSSIHYRSRFKHRLVLASAEINEVKAQLEQFADNNNLTAGAYCDKAKTGRRIVFMFTGQGSQWPGMAAKMYGHYPVFTEQLDLCDQQLQKHNGFNLKKFLLDVSADEISDTVNAQPALFAFEYAWAKQWLAWGVKPVCLLGHSLGEYVAACLAGVFDLTQALDLIVARAELMQQTPGNGGMAAVFVTVEPLTDALTQFPALSIAAYNAVDSQVVSGPIAQLDDFLNQCSEQGWSYSRLHTSHGFHSQCMEPVIEPFSAALTGIKLRPAQLPIISNLTAKNEQNCYAQADYWTQHLRQPVQFHQGLLNLSQQGVDTVIEIGPKAVLTSLLKQSDDSIRTIAPCRGENSVATINQSIAELVACGVELDWPQLLAGKATELPTYPWQRKRYWPDWLDKLSVQISKIQDNSGQWLSNCALSDDTAVYELRLNVSNQPWLKQHKVFGMQIAPLALFIACIYDALYKRFGVSDFTLLNLTIERALLIPEQGDVILQMQLTQQEQGYGIEFYSRTDNTQSWQMHLTGIAKQAISSKPDELLPPKTGTCIEGSQFYDLFARHGLEYGEDFQGIKQLWQQTDQCAVAELNKVCSTGDFAIAHPVVLDLAMQMLAAVMTSDASSENLNLPASISEIQCFAGDIADCHWLAAEQGADNKVNLRFYNRERQPLFAIDGVGVIEQDKSRLQQLLQISVDWFYRSSWQAYTIAKKPPIKSWLFISDQPEHPCVQQLIELGHQVKLVKQDGLNSDHLDGIDELVDLTALSMSAEPEYAMIACSSLINLLNRLNTATPRLTLVSRQALAEFYQPVNYAGAALWGLAAVLFQEHSELKPRIIDIRSNNELFPALLDDSHEQRLSSTEQGLMVPRLQHYSAKPERDININSEGCYLITGGLGALGQSTVNWLVERGARQVFLTSRQYKPVLPDLLRELTETYPDLKLLVKQTDINSETEVEQLFSDIAAGGQALKGIVHCAGFTDDDRLVNQTPERLERLNQSKLQAAVLLDQYSRTQPIDFFLLYSSFNAVLGSVGQGAYAAANAAMDALAWQRQHQGYPALSINWGPWQTGIQQQSSSALRTFWQQSGIGLIGNEQAGSILDVAISQRQSQLSVVNFDWNKLSQSLAGEAIQSLLQYLIRHEPEQHTNWLERIQQVNSGQQKALLTDFVRQHLCGILKLPPAQLQLDCLLSSLGLDSLAAVEFRSVMRKQLRLEIPVSRLLQSNAQGLVDYLLEQINGEHSTVPLAIQEEEEDMLEGEI